MLLPALCTLFGLQQDSEHTWWATAAHCLPPVGQIVLIQHPTDATKKIEARVIARNEIDDTGIVKAWTKDCGIITTKNVVEPEIGPALISTHRGTIEGFITNDEIAIRGLSPRRLANARVIPGDSGSAILQDDDVVGVVTHTVDGCRTGFCPGTLAQNKQGGLIDEFETAVTRKGINQLTEITMRDVILAIAAFIGGSWWTNNQAKKPPAT